MAVVARILVVLDEVGIELTEWTGGFDEVVFLDCLLSERDAEGRRERGVKE